MTRVHPHTRGRGMRLGLGLWMGLWAGLASATAGATESSALPMADSERCAWQPGSQIRFQGELAPLLDRYQDLTPPLRARLRQRLNALNYDDIVTIRRDSITGTRLYAAQIQGWSGALEAGCSAPSRAHWPDTERQLALVFCEGGQCLMLSVEGRQLARIETLAVPMAERLALDPETELSRNPPAAAAAPPAEHAPGRLLLGSRAGLSDEALAKILGDHQGRARRIGRSQLHVVELPVGSEKAVAALLARHPQLKFAELDRRLPPALAVNDPYAGSAWHLAKIGAPTAWDHSQGAGVTIAILDTGVDGSHPDLSARMVAGWNIVDNNGNTADVHGHGTAVAGAAAATLNNGTGVPSVAGQARIMPLRVADANAYAYYSSIAQGLDWAMQMGARVANISYAAGGSAAVQSAAQAMKNRGGLVIVAAGNTGMDDGLAPTGSLLIVSATDRSDLKTSWSSYGAALSLSAPGLDIWTTVRGGGYQAWWGTSLASPVVAGVVGLMMAARPDLGSSQLESLLLGSSQDLGAPGRDSFYGYGRVDAAAAVRASLAATAQDTEPPSVSISAPAEGSSVSGWVAVDAQASDNMGLARVDLLVDGRLLASDASAPYGFSWNSALLGNGMHSLQLKAVDGAGNTASSLALSVQVANALPPDSQPPLISIRTPAPGARVSGTVSISTSASDDSGAAGLRQTLRIDGVQVASGNGSSLSYSWNTRKVGSGLHTIEASAQDATGKLSVSSITVSK